MQKNKNKYKSKYKKDWPKQISGSRNSNFSEKLKIS